MGTSVSSIHVYTNSPVSEPGKEFRCFSEGWQTLIPKEEEELDWEADKKLARRISRNTSLPVLWFWEFDSDEYGFVLFNKGRQVTSFGSDKITCSGTSSCFKISFFTIYPPLIKTVYIQKN